jgi:hypothetical protein
MAIFTTLKWQQCRITFTTTHWPLAIKLSAFFISFLGLTVSHFES